MTWLVLLLAGGVLFEAFFIWQLIRLWRGE